MSSKFKDSKFVQKLKSFRISRGVAVTVATVLVVAVAIIAITVSANKAPATDPDGTKAPVGTQEPSDSAGGTPDNNEPDADVVEKVPALSLPVSGVLSSKHDPELQVYSPTMNDYRVHLGIDINTTEGAAVYAAADGTVEKVWEDPMMGYCIAISHGADSCTVYKNLAKTVAEGVAEGVKVNEGQLIGAIGDSAMIEIAHEPHLHFEMTVAGIQVDPLKYFADDALAVLSTDDGYEK
ncbi:MAG: M23 family metallopeptidase [Clostridia bacterium]|nr:M23 family metallopeptidase [Clostridia bacterium]